MLILGTHPESQHPSGVQGRFSNVEGARAKCVLGRKKSGLADDLRMRFTRTAKHLVTFLKLFLALSFSQSEKTYNGNL